MDNLQVVAESIIKIEEVKEEPRDNVEESLWNSIELGESSIVGNLVKEDYDVDEEELKPALPVWVQPNEDTEGIKQEEEDPLASGCENISDGLLTKKEGTCSPSAAKEAPATRGRVAPPPAGERPLRCSLCDAAFRSHNGLRHHRRTHTGERPYSCDVCPAAFNSSSSLIRHKRTHTGERPYSCDVCGAAFKTSYSLTAHKRTHTGERPYPCVVCRAAFVKSSSLIRHMRSHTGERPYSCDVCGAAFNTSSNLNAHKRIHRA